MSREKLEFDFKGMAVGSYSFRGTVVEGFLSSGRADVLKDPDFKSKFEFVAVNVASILTDNVVFLGNYIAFLRDIEECRAEGWCIKIRS